MASRPKVFAAALLLIACCNAFSSDDDLQLVQPRGNGLKLERLKTKEGSDARFTGQTWITGRFVAWWPAGASNASDKTPEYLLIPDAKGAAKLPHFTLLYEHQRHRYPVKTIDLTNGEDALRRIVGEAQARQLLDRHVDSVDANGKFLLEDYSVGVECDAAWAHAMFIKAEAPRSLFAGHGDVPERC